MSRFDIDPESFLSKMENGEIKDSMILDVRELPEWDYYHLEESVLMPMNMIPDKLEELPQDKMIYVICAHGVRSAMVCNYLIANGCLSIRNVQGGMAAVSGLRGFQYD